MPIPEDGEKSLQNADTSTGIEADLQKLKVFISHRHADSTFAAVIGDKLREWGFKIENIFITSKGSMTPGDNIDQSIKANLDECDLLIHIFTRSSQNWEWVAREIGIAETLPNSPRIITFQIFDDEPNIRQSNLWVPVEETAIRGFVNSLFTKDGFFPGYLPVSPIPEDEGFKRQSHSDYIENQSQDLYKLLKEAADNFGTADLKLVNQEEAPELNVFISLRVEDIELGEKLKEKIESWKFFNVKMSHAKSPSGETVSSSGEEIVNFLWDCHLVILLFTDASADWGQCDSDIGIAHDPRVKTTTIVLQVLDDPSTIRIPSGMRNFFIDTRNLEVVQKFIEDLFHRPDFFSGFAAVQPRKTPPWEAYTKSEGDELFGILEDYRKKAGPDRKPEPYEEEPRWSQARFHLSASDYNKCFEQEKILEKHAFVELLRKSLRVVGGNDYGLGHFGYTDLEKAIKDNVNLEEMFQYWKSTANDPNSNKEWANEMAEEIWAFRKGQGGFNLSWKPFHNLNPQSPCYVYPVVTSVAKFHDESRTYTVYLFVVPDRFLLEEQLKKA